MSYIIESITIKDPSEYSVTPFETSSTVTSLTGKSTKDVRNVKKVHKLKLENVTPTQANQLVALYELGEPVTFQINETNCTLAETTCILDISDRDHLKGGSYLENFDIILTEEQ